MLFFCVKAMSDIEILLWHHHVTFWGNVEMRGSFTESFYCTGWESLVFGGFDTYANCE